MSFDSAWINSLWNSLRDVNWTTTEATTALAWSLLHFLWQGALIALLLGIVLRVTHKATSQYGLSLTALVLMAVAPLLTFACVYEAAATQPMSALADVSQLTLAERSALLTAMERGEVPQRAESSSGAALASASPWPQWILVSWLVGVGLFVARLAIDVGQVYYLRGGRIALPQDVIKHHQDLLRKLGFADGRHLYISYRVRDAVAVGFWRPCVLLPASWLTQLTPDMLEAVIAHELAHIRRFDLWIRLFQRVVEVGLFYHPAVWLVSRRVREASELCCDEWAIARTGRRVTYVETLQHLAAARLAESETPVLRPALFATMGDRPMKLFDRINYLLGSGRTRRSSLWRSAATLCVLTLGVTTAAVSFAAADDPQGPPDPSKVASAKVPTSTQDQDAEARKAQEDVERELEAAMREIEKELAGIGGDVAKELEAAMREVEKELAGAQGEIEKELAGGMKELEKELAGADREVENELAEAIKELEKELGEAQGEIEKEMAEAMQELELELAKELPEVEKELAEAMKELEQELGKELPEIEKELKEALKDIEDELGGELGEVLQGLGVELDGLSEEIQKELKKELEGNLQGAFGQLNESGLGQLQQEIEKEIGAALKDVNVQINGIDEQVQEQIEQAMKQIEQAQAVRPGLEEAQLQALIEIARNQGNQDGVNQEAIKKAIEQAKRAAEEAMKNAPNREQIENIVEEARRAAEQARKNSPNLEQIERMVEEARRAAEQARKNVPSREQVEKMVEEARRAVEEARKNVPNLEQIEKMVEEARRAAAQARRNAPSREHIEKMAEEARRAAEQARKNAPMREQIRKMVEEARRAVQEARENVPNREQLEAMRERARSEQARMQALIQELVERAGKNADNNDEQRDRIEEQIRSTLEKLREELRRNRRSRGGDDDDNSASDETPAGEISLAT